MKSTSKVFERTNNFKSSCVMKMAFLLLICFSGVLNLNAQSTQEFTTSTDSLVVYSDVPGLAPSDKYTIRVRSAATNNVWVDVFINYNYNRAFELTPILNYDGVDRVNIVQGYAKFSSGWSHAYGNIEMNKGQIVEVEIAAKNGFKIGGQDFFKAKVHPAQKASAATIINGKIYFTISNPGQIYIDINGQMDDYHAAINPIGHPIHPIMLFANPVIKKPSLNSSRVKYIEPGTTLTAINNTNPTTYDTMYFKSGVHDIGSGIKLHPGKTIYISGDAKVYGTFNNTGISAGTYSTNGENINIYGYGTISGTKIPHYQYAYYYPSIIIDGDNPIEIENSLNSNLFGVTLADNAGQSIELNGPNCTMKWLKTISWRVNGDGLGGYATADDCFIRSADDCSYMKANRRRCTFWKDTNAALFHMPNIPENTIEPLMFEDCDVLYARLPYPVSTNGAGFQQRGSGTPGQRSVNVIARDFRFHDTRINMPVFGLDSQEGSSYTGILFQNISIGGMAPGNMQKILGSKTSPWYGGMTFDSITIAGTLITQQNYPTYFTTNEYVNNIVFNASVNYNISVSANAGGAVYGSGSYNKDQSITVTAIPSANNSFVNWTENGVPVSTNASYTFTVTQNRTLVANFLDVTTIPNVVALSSWVSGNTNNKVSAANRLLTVMVMGESATDFSATSITYGGQTMTKQTEKMHTDGFRTYSAIFTLDESGVNAASSGNIVVSWSAAPSSGSSVYSILLANVNQITPITASANNGLTGTNVSTSPLLAGNGDMLLMCGATAANNVASVNNGFTEQFESNSTWGDGVGGSKMGSGANETPSFSQSVSGRMALCAINIKYSAVVTKQNQTITFLTIPTKTFGDAPFSLGATATSGLAVSYVSSNTAVATVSDNTVTIVGAGTSTITASQTGNANFNAATPVVQTLIVIKAIQTITFPAIATKTIGDADFNAGATASSGLAVTYTSSNTAVATIVGGSIHIVGIGTANITASQTGNANYIAATSVVQTLTVIKATQTITFPAIATKTFGDADFNPGATASSGLAVTYTSSNTAVATIVGENIHIVGAGTANITASQAGNANYNAAPSVVQTLTVNPSQTLPDVTALTNWVSGTNNPKVAGSERMMVVMVMGEHTATFMANSATYGGQAMTRVTDKIIINGSSTYSAIFILKETGVNAATSGTINVTWSVSPAGSIIYSVLLANIDQTTTIAKALNGLASAATISTSTTLAAANGDMVVMCGATEKNNTITLNNGFTKKNESNSAWGDGVTGMKMGTGVNETPSFTQSASGRMVICAIVAKKATTAKSASIRSSQVANKTVNRVKVYPNPVSGILNIDFSDSETMKEIRVFSSVGQLVYNTRTQNNTAQIDVQSLKIKGIACVQIVSGNEVSTHKIVVR